MYPSYDLAQLREAVRPFKLIWSPRMRSTNDRAVALRRRSQLFAPTVVVTGHQTAGRGRGSNKWFSNGGVLTATFAVAAATGLEPHHLPLLAGLAVRAAAVELSGVEDIALKWPNDIIHGGLKLGGLLCQRLENLDLIGVGLNVNLHLPDLPRSLRDKATSLAALCGRTIDPNTALSTLARHLDQTLTHYGSQPFAAIQAEYNRHLAQTRQRLTVLGAEAAALQGVCEGIDEDGRLLLRQGKTLHRIVNGHVES
jgi:BirA family biotin operon repressor/biotin-[acetyl-CoA-carboxylase] ligase